MKPMGSTSIDGLRNKCCFPGGVVGVRLDRSYEKRGSNTEIKDQISRIMLRYELLLGIVVSCKCCSSKYRQKIGWPFQEEAGTDLVGNGAAE
jgi:hypothetical protein